jgi:Leucine-rich repeat (LRR) protein
MASLTKLPVLEHLDLSECGGIHDSAAELISTIDSLKQLNLWLTMVSDSGVERISRMSKLEWLNLDNTQITDIGVANLKSMKGLTWLHLGSNRVTDASVESLVSMRQLKYLKVAHCPGLSMQAKNRLKSELGSTELEL